MGDAGQGVVLTGQVRGVKPGPGIAIGTDGTIAVDSQTIQGVMKLGQTPASALAAYNGYTWPTTPGSAGQQMTTDGAGNLTWGDSDGIPWTAKGQLIVGTGAGTDTLLNVGGSTAFLVADSLTTSGLRWSDSSTSAAQMPAGATGARPSPAAAGQIRFNTTTNKFEFYTGGGWETVASAPSGSTFVIQTTPTTGSASAVIPSGTTAQQQTVPAPLAGYTRFNTDTTSMEVFDGTTWTAVGAPPVAGLGIAITGNIVKVAIPQASTPPTPGAGAAQAVVGSMYWDDVLNQLFIYYSNGGSPIWVQAAPSASGGSTYTATAPIVVTGTVISVNLGLGLVANGTNLAFSCPVAATPPAINTTPTGGLDGSFYWDNTLGQLFIRYNNSGSPVWVAAAPPAGGGGAGTVTTVTGTAPIAVATGSTTPVVSITPGTARQLMQTNAGGTAAEFASNIDVPGTLDVTGVGTFDADLKFNSGYGSAVTAYGCRAWVSFNGTTSPPTVKGSGNVSSVTKAGAGDFTVNFTTAMPDANYSAVASTNNNETLVSNPVVAGSFRILARDISGNPNDTTVICAAVFR